MTDYQHTPPPWRVFEGNGEARGSSWISVTTINQDCARRIATIENRENWSAEYQANVCLIALAPELLEMLDRVVLYLSDGWIDENTELYEAATSLIAKASEAKSSDLAN